MISDAFDNVDRLDSGNRLKLPARWLCCDVGFHSDPCGQSDRLILDIGGEGRHEFAWNVNPSQTITFGARRGDLIPRHIAGRANAIPFPDDSVSLVFVERTPLLPCGLREIRRVIAPGGLIVLRHAVTPCGDPHRIAKAHLPGKRSERCEEIGQLSIQETTFCMPF